MKLNLFIASLVMSVGLCTQGFGFELLDRMLGAGGCGCDADCCETARCDNANACGCEKAAACGCEDACDSGSCCKKQRCHKLGGWLHGMMGCRKNCCDNGCDGGNGCGCDSGCDSKGKHQCRRRCKPACTPACGFDNGCDNGCDCGAKGGKGKGADVGDVMIPTPPAVPPAPVVDPSAFSPYRGNVSPAATSFVR